MKYIRVLLLVFALLAGATACVETDEPGTYASRKVDKEPKANKGDKPTAEKSKPAEPSKPALSAAQENAIAKAADYLDYDAFSRPGLIEQLSFEGFSKKDATFAVDYLKVDWNAQAAAKAKDYLDYDAFSRSGLIEQLKFEGFTPEQAAYGATKAGL